MNINILKISWEKLRTTIIGLRYNYHNSQDNQPNNLNNELTNQSKGYQYHQIEYKQ